MTWGQGRQVPDLFLQLLLHLVGQSADLAAVGLGGFRVARLCGGQFLDRLALLGQTLSSIGSPEVPDHGLPNKENQEQTEDDRHGPGYY